MLHLLSLIEKGRKAVQNHIILILRNRGAEDVVQLSRENMTSALCRVHGKRNVPYTMQIAPGAAQSTSSSNSCVHLRCCWIQHSLGYHLSVLTQAAELVLYWSQVFLILPGTPH